MSHRVVLAVTLATMAACAPSAPPPPPAPPAPPAPSPRDLPVTPAPESFLVAAPDPSWTTCTDGSDCVVVEVKCCDHCNNGQGMAVNKASVAKATATRPATCTEDCSEMACPNFVGVCEGGTCKAWFGAL